VVQIWRRGPAFVVVLTIVELLWNCLGLHAQVLDPEPVCVLHCGHMTHQWVQLLVLRVLYWFFAELAMCKLQHQCLVQICLD
jgi:hypothetical protein